MKYQLIDLNDCKYSKPCVGLFLVLLNVFTVFNAHAQPTQSTLFTESHMGVLCATDFLDEVEIDVRLQEFDEDFMIYMASLCDIWSVTSAISLPSERDLAVAACENMLQGDRSENIYYSFYDYGGDNNLAERYLCYLATHDGDNDQIPDFAVDGCGFFTDNDPDIDNDQVLNWFDTVDNVSTSGVARQDQCAAQEKIPDLLKWNVLRIPGGHVKTKNFKDCSGIDRPLCNYQNELWDRYGILIYERSEVFTLELATVLSDVIEHVFVTRIKQHSLSLGCDPINMIKAVSVALYPVRETEVNDCGINTDILAEAKPNTFELVIYPYNMGAVTPLYLLVLLAHEIAHFYQYSMDFKDKDLYTKLMTEDKWITAHFDQSLKEMGWTFQTRSPDEFIGRKGKMVSVEADPISHLAHTYQLIERPLKHYENQIVTKNVISEKSQSEVMSVDEAEQYDQAVASLQEGSVVSSYSLSDPWEWHSEVVAAYVLKSIEKHIVGRFVGTLDTELAKDYSTVSQTLIDRLHRSVFSLYKEEDDTDAGFNYRMISDEMFAFLESGDQLPISASSLDYLTCRYVIRNADEVFNSDLISAPAKLYDKPLDAEEIQALQRDVTAYWGDLCSQF